MELSQELSDLLSQIWQDLQRGANDAHSPLHSPAFGTIGPRGCSLRTVVLRRVEPEARQIYCHIDIRSDKVEEIRANPAVSYLFYAAEEKIQIRAEGLATVHYQDEVAQLGWQNSRLSSRRAYLANPGPGTKIERPDSGLPSNMLDRSPNQVESELGWPNFAVILTTVQRLDWLYLAASGHRRAQFEWTGNSFTATYVIP